MRTIKLLALAALVAAFTTTGLSAAPGGRAVRFRVTYPARVTVARGGASATLSGRFVCAATSSVSVRGWIFQHRSGALGEGRFPVHAATAAQKALADCTGASRNWSVDVVVKDTAPGKLKAGAATACYVVALKAHGGLYTSLTSRCAPLLLR